MSDSKTGLVLQALGVAAGVAVSILAIWGNYFRAKLAAPKLRLVPHNLGGNLTRLTLGGWVVYYHLKVQNRRPWSVAKNCRVLLKQIDVRGPDQEFNRAPLVVPLQFVWAPAELTSALVDITREHVLDFIRLKENDDTAYPVLYGYPNEFRGLLTANGAIRYGLEVAADGVFDSRLYVFEVAWNGRWSRNMKEMAHNLTVKQIR